MLCHSYKKCSALGLRPRLVLWAQLRFASEMAEQSSVTRNGGTTYDTDAHLLS